ncbi:uncharacterized protein LOC6527791 [Drosophila yakuba]|uniref:Uncharacterized protein n=1 Tax=Drosophila yakuba TaxID=7245 RepID=B4NXI5_DROYA|nr:uncharacterized protein LOC6527791 [Drosophila yakuba]EDW88576.1 uncharacterized protein Dyak_GE18798 [Drosophila yakuba]
MNNPNGRWNRLGRSGRDDGDGGGPAEGPEILVINERQLRAFIIRVYLSSVVLCILSSIPWIIISALNVKVKEDIPVPAYVWLILTFIILIVLSCIRQTPALTLLCWGLVLGCVFFITLFGTYYMHMMRVWDLLAIILLAGSLLGLLHLYGAKGPEILLPNVLCTCCIFLLLTVTLFVLVILYLVIKDLRYLLAFAILFAVLILFMAPFQARFICGRLQHVPYGETADCALGIYLYFAFLVNAIFVFALYYDHTHNKNT